MLSCVPLCDHYVVLCTGFTCLNFATYQAAMLVQDQAELFRLALQHARSAENVSWIEYDVYMRARYNTYLWNMPLPHLLQI